MKSCLIVDDSHVVRKVARRIAEDLGFSCSEAGDGQEAFAFCQGSLPDVIFLDWNMPAMSGAEFLEHLRALENGKHPKVIFCTTENDPVQIARALAAGVDEYVMKPFDRDILRMKLMQVGMVEKA